MRRRLKLPSPSMGVALLALAIALGGTSYAAVKVGSGDVRNNSLTSKDIRNNTIRSGDVRNGTLLARDFRAADLPAGARGAPGATGPAGPIGPVGPKGDKGDKGDTGDTGVSTIVLRRTAIPIPANSTAADYAVCEEQEKLVSGGAGWSGGASDDQTLGESGPVDADGSFNGTETGETATQWYATGHNGEATADTLYVWALCAS